MAKVTKPDRTRHALTVAQLNAIDLLVTGTTDRETAEAVGVTRQTVNGWRNQDPWFRAALNRARAAVWGGASDGLRALLPQAVDALAAELAGGEHRARVALDLLRLLGLDCVNLGDVGPTDASTFIDHVAFGRRPPPADDLGGLLAALTPVPLTEEERCAAVAEMVARMVEAEVE